MEATNVQSSKSTNEVPNLEEAHDENKEGGSKVEKDKRKKKAVDEPTSKNPEPRDEGSSVLTSVHFDVDACRQALARMIIMDELPFKFVEREGFRYFMSIVQPKLPIPGRISAARDCWSLYIIDNASSNDVAISYLKSRMEDWNTHPLKGEHMHARCCAHILNLVVQDGLKEWNSSISNIRNAVRYVRASPGHMDKFRICIKEARLQDKSIVQLDVSTRWNFTYLMLESVLKFQKTFKRLGGNVLNM
ncbi:hypothetical protein F3Y22_tig00117056pilonHSYRG01275 [Hibiscus syriacus]|uniref:Uncharacterized protein n=1 Tax=Hibiscus syriacus TaxID=106335 RepID=A0A6A2W8Z6_HIBSY|nr:hypothetical protein F3Y22_tig00117056pilonHSYRG01275 [Hibiscus syriacus]